MKKLLAYYINPFTGDHRFEPILDTLECFYKELDCDMVEMHTIRLGDREYLAIMDEEGLLKGYDKIRVSAFWSDDPRDVAFIGSLLIVGDSNDDGDLTTLTQDDIDYIERFVKPMTYKVGYAKLTNVALVGIEM